MHKIKSIATKISIYIGLLVLIICASLGVLAYNRSSSAVLAEIEKALIAEAEEASSYVESRFELQLTLLETIAQRAEIRSMIWQVQEPAIQSELERLSQFLAIGVADRNGFARFSDGTSADLADNDHIIRALAGESVVSELIISEIDNSLILVYAVPIKNNGQVMGVLLGRQNGTMLSDITDRLGHGENGWAYIFNQDGTIYAHPDRDYILNQANIFTDTGELANVGRAVKEFGVDSTGTIGFTLNNTALISALTPIPSTGWIIGVAALESEVLANINQLRTFLIGFSIALFVLGIIAAMVIAKQIANPLQEMQEVVEYVADGDLTRTVQVKSDDEVGKVAKALNSTITRVSEAMSLVANATDELAGTSQEMAAASEEVSASIEEVASTTNHFSSALDLMNNNAQSMEEAAQNISEQALQGESAIEEINKHMSALRDTTMAMSSDVANLGTLSGEVGRIVDVIGAIADQTNLLALNAAIEAARAGEHGRGFAVVADEVRQLAEQSFAATLEITSLIGQIQGGISSTVTGMENSASEAEQAMNSVEESGQLLRNILSAVEGIVGQVQELSAGIEESNSGGHEIASASEEQAASIQQVASSAQDLTDMGLRLQELVRHFKLQD